MQNWLLNHIMEQLNQPNNGKFKCSHTKYGIFCANCGAKMETESKVPVVPCFFEINPSGCPDSFCRNHKTCAVYCLQKDTPLYTTRTHK